MATLSKHSSVGAMVPTRARHVATLFAVLLAVVMYIDRVTLSQAAPFIRQDLGLSPIQWGWVASMFGWAYALFEIPGGWLGDRLGPRKVLIRIVIWWSAFTAATGMVWNLSSLIITQTLFGMGEAGCFPNLTRVFQIWLPKKDRERAQSILWLATRWGGALTPILVMYMLRYLHLSWRLVFVIVGSIGIFWAVAFYRWFRDNPAEHPSVNAAELAMLPSASETATVHTFPFKVLFSNKAVMLLCIQYACLAYGWWFYVTWLPTYLREARQTTLQMNPIALALITGFPLLFGGVGCLIAGRLGPWIAQRIGSVVIGRRIMAITGFVGASLSIFFFTTVEDPIKAMVVLGFAGFFNDFIMPSAWAGAMDVGGRYAGTVSGAMNMVGGIAGATSTLIVGYLLAFTGNDWTMTLYISASIYLLGAIAWLFLDSHTPMQQPDAA